MTKILASEVFRIIHDSPLAFVRVMWGLIPQERWEEFQLGKHITWQQAEILSAVERAIQNKDKKRISIRSGHGIGKSTTLAWLILWFLFTRPFSQVPCTAPTSDQLFDVLWKELAKWIYKLPKEIQTQFEWSTTYIRMKERPETWFARARTARKEAPEALAGIHGEHVLFICDEASGIPEEIYNVAEGALTGEKFLVILISNPTRLTGYFYDTHHRDREAWQTLNFSSLDSPIVEADFAERIVEKHGRDSDEYAIRVLGDFPKADSVDAKGYIPLFSENDLHYTQDATFNGTTRLGIDPAGEGKNKTAYVIRDAFKAKIVGLEEISTPKGIAQRAMGFIKFYKVPKGEVYVDNFGVGANVVQELAIAGVRVQGVNVGDKAKQERFLNLRAEAYWNLKEWIRKGGELYWDDRWKELLTIKYRPTLANKIQIMPKDEMRKVGLVSPDVADSFSLLFTRGEKKEIVEEYVQDFDRFSVV